MDFFRATEKLFLSLAAMTMFGWPQYPLQDRIPQYAVYWVGDGDTKQSDTNHGKYFDVRFCDVHGERSELGVKWEAQSYTGVLTPYGIDRPVDFAKAIDILEEHIHAPTRGELSQFRSMEI
jgi:hypothetical protein